MSGLEAVARTTAVALYRNAFIVAKGKFDEKQLVEVYARLLAKDNRGLDVQKFESPDGPYVTVTTKVGETQYTVFLSHSIHLPARFYEDMEGRSRMVDIVRIEAPKLVQSPELDPKFLRQFFTK